MPPSNNKAYSKTNAKHWCEFCRVYIYSNNISRTRHDNSPQHKSALARYVERVQREEREQERLIRDLQGRTGVTLEKRKRDKESSSFYPAQRKAPPVDLLSMKGPAMAKKKPKLVLGAAPQQSMGQSAIVGPWESRQSPTTAPNNGEIDGRSSSSEPMVSDTDEEEKAEMVEQSTTAFDKPAEATTTQEATSNITEDLITHKPIPIKIELRKVSKPPTLRK